MHRDGYNHCTDLYFPFTIATNRGWDAASPDHVYDRVHNKHSVGICTCHLNFILLAGTTRVITSSTTGTSGCAVRMMLNMVSLNKIGHKIHHSSWILFCALVNLFTTSWKFLWRKSWFLQCQEFIRDWSRIFSKIRDVVNLFMTGRCCMFVLSVVGHKKDAQYAEDDMKAGLMA